MAELDSSPYDFFEACFAKAIGQSIPQPNAMTLVTATPDGKPSARVVLLKEVVHDQGFRFFTNYESRKARELLANPRAQLLFYWPQTGRQIRIEGRVAKISAADSDAYWVTRPRGSRVGAIASQQSRELDSMDALRARAAEVEREYDGKPIPRPEGWGGFELVPDFFEFWEDRPDRLHERITYTRSPSGWKIGRLNP